jgi:methyl-accepting chemotaxis protein
VTVKQKLLSGLGTILLMVMVLGATGIWNMTRSLQSAEITGASTRATAQLANAQNALWQLRYGVQQFILYTDQGARDKIIVDEARLYKVFDGNLAEFGLGSHSTAEMSALAKLRDLSRKYKDARQQWFKLYGEWKLDEAGEWRSKTLAPLSDATLAELAHLIQLQQQSAAETGAAVARQTQWQRGLMAVLLVATVVLAGIVAYLTIRAITRPLGRALGVANQVAEGNLSGAVEVDSNDEFGRLLQALRTMHGNLTRMVQEIRTGAESIRHAAGEVAAGNANISRRTEQQAATLEQTAASMEQLTSTVRENTQGAESANMLANDANQLARQGGEAVQAMVATMSEIHDSSKKIGDITGVIDGIAFQTNILALNAAVEAARAGEQGRGFAVVASEVRALAQRSADAAREIKVLIGESMRTVSVGAQQADAAGKAMGNIVDSSAKVLAIIDQISVASRDQAGGIEQVNRAVTEMEQAVQQNAAVVEQAAAAADAMRSSAQNLHGAVSVFRLSDGVAAAPDAEVMRGAPPRVQRLEGMPAAAIKPARPAATRPLQGPPSATASALPRTRARNDGEWKEF